jgi:hypothetical protein
MPRPNRNRVQIAIRVPREWLALADRLAADESRLGWELSRTDAFRIAMAEGFKALRVNAKGRPK